jgi:transcriptional regulator with XRE-family HTH domain
MNDIARLLGKRIKLIRIEKDLLQSDLAQLTGRDPSYLGRIERGEVNIRIETLVTIATALDIKPSEIFKKIDL